MRIGKLEIRWHREEEPEKPPNIVEIERILQQYGFNDPVEASDYLSMRAVLYQLYERNILDIIESRDVAYRC